MKINSIHIIILSLVVVWLLPSCDIHEFTDGPQASEEPVTVTLTLDFTLEMPPYKDFIYEQYNTREGEQANYDLRYQMRLFYAAEPGKFSSQPVKTLMLTQSDISEFNTITYVDLKPGYYRCAVWTDYVVKGTTEDLVYDTTDFSAIKLITPHSGNNDFRDAFYGITEFELLPETDTSVTVAMERPLGKFRFIANDFDTFVSRSEEMIRQQWETSRNETPSQVPAEVPKFNVEDYEIVIRYPGFMPNVFNMFTNRPSDASTGNSFTSKISQLSDTEAELGFDYVFVNGAEAPITLMVEVYDKGHNLVGASPQINVPMKRSKLTTVRGKFLTSESTGGVGVNPGFEGELNIFIP